MYTQENGFIYPEGVYSDYNDFKVKVPSLQTPIDATQGKNAVITTFRIKDGTGNKIKDAFAVSDGAHIYVRTNAILEYLTNTESDKPNATGKDYSIAQLANEDYLYFEVFFQSKSVKNWGVGKIYLSGIIFNTATGKFTILESIKDMDGAGIPLMSTREKDTRVNGQNIDLARKAVLPLFKKKS